MPYTYSLKSLALTSSALCLIGGIALADQVILDDLIVDGSICAGMDCVNGESFGFDTIRIKENNLRIRAVDTSSTSSFPTNDWQITFNDSANGGANKFSIDDIDGGRTPFTLEAGAPSHSLYVDDGGRLGLGTSTPVVDVHVKSGNTPTLRLEQDGSSGFTPQTWDVAGNEAGFFIRDATNGSLLSLRIETSAPASSVHIDNTGNVGMGTSSPEAELHIRRTDASSTRLLLENTNAADQAVQIRLISDSDTNRRIIGHNGSAVETQISLDNNKIVFAGSTTTSDTWATIDATGIVTNIGSCTTGSPCDAVFNPDIYTVPSIETHAEQMWDNGFLPAVGPTLQGQPVNVTAKMTSILNELEHAHIYIEQLNSRINELETEIKG